MIRSSGALIGIDDFVQCLQAHVKGIFSFSRRADEALRLFVDERFVNHDISEVTSFQKPDGIRIDCENVI